MRSGGGLRALLQAGGGRALYTGVWGNLAGVRPASAIFMGVYEPIKCRVADQAPPGREWLGPLIAGATAGVAASVVRVPTEVVKQRMQSGELGGAALGAVRTIIAREGVRGMFAGYGSFLLRDIPFDAIEFVAYEQLKRAYAATLKGRDVNAAEVSAIGAAAGAITGVVTTPLDVLKTRLMTQGASGRYKGIVDCTTKIVQEEGVGTLFRVSDGRRGGWREWERAGGGVRTLILTHSPSLFTNTHRAGSRASCGSAWAAASSSRRWSKPSVRTRPRPRTGPWRRPRSEGEESARARPRKGGGEERELLVMLT